jgi:hypothetical protein
LPCLVDTPAFIRKRTANTLEQQQQNLPRLRLHTSWTSSGTANNYQPKLPIKTISAQSNKTRRAVQLPFTATKISTTSPMPISPSIRSSLDRTCRPHHDQNLDRVQTRVDKQCVLTVVGFYDARTATTPPNQQGPSTTRNAATFTDKCVPHSQNIRKGIHQSQEQSQEQSTRAEGSNRYIMSAP